MSALTFAVGDATLPEGNGPKIVAHVCNDGGGWGRGFVLAISRRWGAPEAAYRTWFAKRGTNDFALGAVEFVNVAESLWVANMIGQHGTRPTAAGPPVRYGAIRTALQSVRAFAQEKGASVHMPRIGCGLAGGRWDQIEPIAREELCDHGIAVSVYDLPT